MQQLERDNKERYREIFAAAGLCRNHLVFPVFVSDRAGGRIESMPGMTVTPVEKITQHVQTIVDSGIPSLIVFGIPRSRDGAGSSAFDRKGVVQRAVRAIKSGFGSSVNVVTDVCVCQYNLSGHCGIAYGNRVDNDATLRVLAQIAASHAEAGADVVAPSSMMDGQVRAIKSALGSFTKTMILSYSAKHASSLYTPFRSAAFGKTRPHLDKSSYQVSYTNPRQVLLEIATDINEGADMVMIKPALAYLDLVRLVKDRFSHPVAVQNVSGEYAMIKAAAMRGLVDEEEWKVCSIASMKRAGADRIISYFALDVSKYL